MLEEFYQVVNGRQMTYVDSNDHQPMRKFRLFCEFCSAPQASTTKISLVWLPCVFVFFLVALSDAKVGAQEPEALEDQSVPAVTPAKPEVAVFGKITVVGSRYSVRSSIAAMADRMSIELNEICGDAGREMKLPVIIRLHGVEGDKQQPRSVVSKITRIQEQYQLVLHVHLARGVDQSLLRYHLMELLLYERGLAEGQFVDEGDRVIVRPWLIIGMLEAIDIKKGRADKKIYQAGVDFLSILPLQKVFDASEKQWRGMIGREPIALRAISAAMVNSLLRQPGGRPAMSAYLADFATFKGEQENLMRKHFPGMNKSTNSLHKWVSLELLELGTARLTDVYSIQETESRLDHILKLRYHDETDDETGAGITVGIDRYDKVIALKPAERVEAVASARAELERLSYRCFPTCRPLLIEYESILRDIKDGKDKEISARLEKLLNVRMKMKESAMRARDYLDWYYITRSNKVSGDFEKYRALTEAIEKGEMRPPANDSAQKYLDEMQRFFGGSRR